MQYLGEQKVFKKKITEFRFKAFRLFYVYLLICFLSEPLSLGQKLPGH